MPGGGRKRLVSSRIDGDEEFSTSGDDSSNGGAEMYTLLPGAGKADKGEMTAWIGEQLLREPAIARNI